MLHLHHARCSSKHILQLAPPCTRLLHTPLQPTHSIYVSKSTNPYFNLTLEDWLYRHKPHKDPLLLLYRDDPCVVIGRNQNPWKEVNMAVSRQTGTPWIRRRSGGGTVYHDLGNTNFSIHLPRSAFDRKVTAQVVLRAVRSLGVDANVNDRNDVCVGKDKVSGSAYKIVNNRAYHHGTMLISTELDKLGDLLHTKTHAMETKGVASVRSPVCNLQHFKSSVTHDDFVQAVVDSFRKEYDISAPVFEVEENDDIREMKYIKKGMEELTQWEWAFGQTPEFTYTVSREFGAGLISATIRSQYGYILTCDIDAPGVSAEVGEQLKDVAGNLAGKKYAFVNGNQVGVTQSTDAAVREVWAWLKSEMEVGGQGGPVLG